VLVKIFDNELTRSFHIRFHLRIFFIILQKNSIIHLYDEIFIRKHHWHYLNVHEIMFLLKIDGNNFLFLIRK
jgi:hypothetical protein